MTLPTNSSFYSEGNRLTSTSLSNAVVDELVGDHLQIRELITETSTHLIYRGRQSDLNREVAVKLVRNSKAKDTYGGKRKLSPLDHPNFLRIYDVYRTFRGECYIVMEYFRSYNLRELLDGGGIDSGHAESWIPQLCMAVDFAHRSGIVHGDIRPSNVLIDDDGRAKLTSCSAQSGVNSLDDFSFRTDLYDLGVLLLEMLTGTTAMESESLDFSWMGLDHRFEAVLSRALSSDRKKRYQSALEMADDILEVAKSRELPLTMTTRVLLPVKKSPRRSRASFPWAWVWSKLGKSYFGGS